MSAALGDAAWMTGMERNSDLVIMSCYALIGYDALNAYGSPAYYAQQMFSVHHGDLVLPVSPQGVPTREWQPPAGRGAPGAPPPATPVPQQVPTLFFDATRDSRRGAIYLKLVNRAGTPQPVRVETAA